MTQDPEESAGTMVAEVTIKSNKTHIKNNIFIYIYIHGQMIDRKETTHFVQLFITNFKQLYTILGKSASGVTDQ